MSHFENLKHLEEQLEALYKTLYTKEKYLWNMIDKEIDAIRSFLEYKLNKKVYATYSIVRDEMVLTIEDCPTIDDIKDRVNYRPLEDVVKKYFKDSHIKIRSNTLLTLAEAQIANRILEILCDRPIGDDKK